MKCYKCLTTKGWDDCKDIKTEMDCPAGYDRCFKGSAHVKDEGASVEEYGKGCMTKEDCNTDLSTIVFCKARESVNWIVAPVTCVTFTHYRKSALLLLSHVL